jgi:fimbrial chaperone protein
MKRQKSTGHALTGVAVLLCLASSAQAGSFSVNPVRVTLSPKQVVGALTVRNLGAETAVIQLETLDWSQPGGQDRLAPTGQILATPPILSIPPGVSRIIRVGLMRPVDPQRELTYRLILREVPPPRPLAQALRVALQISLPVFVDPSHPVAPQLHWRLLRTPDGHLRLEARNDGTAHVQLDYVELLSGESTTPVAVQKTVEYVLPGSARSWNLEVAKAPALGTLLHLRAETDAGNLQANVRLDALSPQAASTEGNVLR